MLDVGIAISLAAAPLTGAAQPAPHRLDRGRFTTLAYPADTALASALLVHAERTDSFPGLPRPRERVLIALAPDRSRFREWSGPGAPEWGAAIALPSESRVVMQGTRAGSDAGDPVQVLRHELAHLALHEWLGDLPPRWFDEGYASMAAGEWGRDELLATSVSLLVNGVPSLDSLDRGFAGGSSRAGAAYALSYRAVVELAAMDRERGLSLFFRYWRDTGSFEKALRSAYGVTRAGFEIRWRERTMRRYGALALVANASLAAMLAAIVVVPLFLVRRRRDKRRMLALIAADDAMDRARRDSAIDSLLAGIPQSSTTPPASPRPSEPPA
ncbi:MAG: peptidase MA family metallohydrolase [Gemmatimonadaceae bacterium]